MVSEGVVDDVVTWRPTDEQRRSSRIAGFLRFLDAERGVRAADYRALWRWSVTEPSAFWDAVREHFGVIGDGFDGPALAEERMPGAVWYPLARLSFAENVLRPALDPVSADRVAIREVHEEGPGRVLTWRQLSDQVAALAASLRGLGVEPGDRVAAVLPNVPEALIGLLAAASIGAVWSVTSPGLSAAAAVDRLAQLEPSVLIGTTGYRFNGKHLDLRDHLVTIREELPTVRHFVLVGPADGAPRLAGAVDFAGLTARAATAHYERVPFAHPLWVLFSSGTTGAPKGIVHGHGGILLEAFKVNGLQADTGPDDTYYVSANTSWMMWNLVVMNLAVGAAVVTYAGSPVLGRRDHLFEILSDQSVTTFGTGAAYLRLAQGSGARPGADFDLSRLRGIMSTGSALPDSTWQWVHDAVKIDVHLGSDSGGTDICSAFLGSNPLETVHRGWLQGPALGAAVEVWNEQGQRVVGEVGELVVTRPMPSMPVAMWNDDDGSRYRGAYFEPFPGVWTHGDWVIERETGEFQVLGRSDATLNRAGVRLGSSDIYSALELVPEVRESLVLGVELPEGGYWLPLFVQLADGAVLDEALQQRINDAIRDRTSARHVPDEIVAAPAIPVTHAGKRIEVPLKRVFLGHPVDRAVNRDALANPEAVDWFVERAVLFRATPAPQSAAG